MVHRPDRHLHQRPLLDLHVPQLAVPQAQSVHPGDGPVQTQVLVEAGLRVGHVLHRLVVHLAVANLAHDLLHLAEQLLLHIWVLCQGVGQGGERVGGGLEAGLEESDALGVGLVLVQDPLLLDLLDAVDEVSPLVRPLLGDLFGHVPQVVPLLLVAVGVHELLEEGEEAEGEEHEGLEGGLDGEADEDVEARLEELVARVVEGVRLDTEGAVGDGVEREALEDGLDVDDAVGALLPLLLHVVHHPVNHAVDWGKHALDLA